MVELEIEGRRYREEMGIRIEDNLLVTKEGCVNLSTSCPKTVSQVEKSFKG